MAEHQTEKASGTANCGSTRRRA